MGLDSVELILALEEAFGLKIPNEHAAQLVTVGAIHTYIRDNAPGATSHPDLWNAVLDVMERELGVERARLVPDAHLVRDLGVD